MTYRKEKGFTLVELMVAVSILAIFFLAAISAFFGIGRGILITKTRTIATTLAQEKIESLKNISYPRLLVTTASDLASYGYDVTHYSTETVVVADIDFTRRVVIHKVRERTDGKLEEISPTSTDTGLKKIKVTVIWSERGEEKSLSLSNLRENPDRKATDSTFSGTVYKSGGGTIDGARIYVEENLNWETYSDTNGTYSLRVSSSTWHLKASKSGYWEQTTVAINIGKSETKTQDFTLTEKAKGNAYGYVYIGSTDTPAVGAAITCNDGLSTVAVSTGTDGYWFLTGIATGTWKIAVTTVTSNGAYFVEISSVNIFVNQSTGVPNYFTSPSSDTPKIILVSTTTEGFISGKVNTDGSIIGTIWVSAGEASSVVDNTTGRYWIQISAGSYDVTVNPTSPAERYNSYYTSLTTGTFTVNSGQITTIGEITLYPAGVVRGKVTSNGIDPLPDVIIVAYNQNGDQVTTENSDSLGEYSFSQLPTSGNTYQIKPELDAGESSSPESVSVDVTQGATVTVSTFTISSAYGKITGTVKENNELIKTGVLIMATTTTISSEPPIINQTLRQGGVYYYATVSGSDGQYELPVRGSVASYNVYAWYTKLSGTTTTTTPKNSSSTVAAGGTATVNFTW